MRIALTRRANQQSGHARAACPEKSPPCRQFPQVNQSYSDYAKFDLTEIKISVCLRPSRSHKRGASRSSETLEAGCGGRACAERRTAQVAYGKAVWSWRPDAGAKERVVQFNLISSRFGVRGGRRRHRLPGENAIFGRAPSAFVPMLVVVAPANHKCAGGWSGKKLAAVVRPASSSFNTGRSSTQNQDSVGPWH